MTINEVIDHEILRNGDVAHANVVSDNIIVIMYRDRSVGVLRCSHHDWHWHFSEPISNTTEYKRRSDA